MTVFRNLKAVFYSILYFLCFEFIETERIVRFLCISAIKYKLHRANLAVICLKQNEK
jgi:hypothetical protein